MGKRGRVRNFKFTEAVVLGRVLDDDTRDILEMLPAEDVSPTQYIASVSLRYDSPAVDRFIARTFDAWLYFENSGPREVAFRLPRHAIPEDVLARYISHDRLKGVSATVSGEDVLLSFHLYCEDFEGFNNGETGEGWLSHILPVRAELLSGMYEALEVSAMIGRIGDRVPGEPDLPPAYGLSKATRTLAAYMLIEPKDLQRWAEKRADSSTSALAAVTEQAR